MCAAVRIRHDAWKISRGTLAAAETQAWHPVLDTYALGVAAMMLRNKNNAMTVDSWLWAANTHQAPANTSPVKPLWKQCAHAKPYFLPWHRAYLAWFENTIRTLTQNSEWALPYWDYTDPARPETLNLPPEFLVAKRTVNGVKQSNPLFVAPNATGRPGAVLADDVDIATAIAEPLFAGDVSRGFGGLVNDGIKGLLETEPHDFVHVDLGGLMGDPRTAGRDPIFYLHHANIDRLWEVWRKRPGSIPLPKQPNVSNELLSKWRSTKFVFGDTGALSTYRMKDMDNTEAAPLGYKYEFTDLPPTIDAALPHLHLANAPGGPMGLDDEPAPSWRPVAGAAEVAVTSAGSRTELALDAQQLGLADQAFAPSGLIIELAGVSGADPHQVYIVDVGVPDAPMHRAGRFSTFGVGTDTDVVGYQIDASATVPALIEEGWTGAGLVVEVKPDPDREQLVRQSAGIQIQQITVLTRP